MSFREFKSILKILIKNKYIKIGLVVNIILLVIGSIVNFVLYNVPEMTNDFMVYYRAGYLVIKHIKDLYNPSSYVDQNFRYLPFIAYIFSLLSIIPEPISFLIYEISLVILNLFIIVLLYYMIFEIYKVEKKYENYVYIILALFLAFGPRLDEFTLGQINTIISFFLLLSLFLFEVNPLNSNLRGDRTIKNANFYGGISIGLAISLKLYLILLLPFVLIFKSPNNKFKNDILGVLKINLQRVFGLCLILLINGIIFIIHPYLFYDFLTLNLFGFSPHEAFFSVSLSRFILNLLYLFGIQVSGLIIMGIFLIPGYLFLFYRYLKKWNIQIQLPEIYTVVIIFIFIVYLDIWFACLIFLAPFFSLFIVRLKAGVNGSNNSLILLDRFSGKDYKVLFYSYILLSINLWLLFPLVVKLIIVPGLNITNSIYLVFMLIISVIMVRKL